MMLPGGPCAVCDQDSDTQTLCAMHTWLVDHIALLLSGEWSEWPLSSPPLSPEGTPSPPPPMLGPLVSERHMMTAKHIAARRMARMKTYAQPTIQRETRMLAQLACVLSACGAHFSADGLDSYGDALAVSGWLDGWLYLNRDPSDAETHDGT